MLAIGNEELGDEIKSKKAVCPNCKKMHKIIYPDAITNGKRVKSNILTIINCPDGKPYVVGIGGKWIR